ncbi:hypothetical protein D4764_07G0001120 [Takifugu flavidus]|uniref:Prothymosin alpha-A n=1 Tax=Takifugu flavidus TaxID=433684 RepID=A0A5C6MR47_9TELE|nr:hypothetical protein D4764_07G0001120 [Takifugu flavidus]
MADSKVESSGELSAKELKDKKQTEEAENGEDAAANGKTDEDDAEQDNDVEEDEEDVGEDEEDGEGDEDDDDDDDLDGPTGKRAADDDDDDEENSTKPKQQQGCSGRPRSSPRGLKSSRFFLSYQAEKGFLLRKQSQVIQGVRHTSSLVPLYELKEQPHLPFNEE